MFTKIEMLLLAHHNITTEPYPKSDKVIGETYQALTDQELLRFDPATRLYHVTSRGRALLDYWQNCSLPTVQWVVKEQVWDGAMSMLTEA